MLSGVDFTRYRCFERLSCDGFARVNLFVGRNNSGKTTVLEGIEAVLGGPERALIRGPLRRREIIGVAQPGGARSLEREDVDPAHLFFGHAVASGVSLVLHARGGAPITAAYKLIADPAHSRARRLSGGGGISPVDLYLQAEIDGGPNSTSVPLSAQHGIVVADTPLAPSPVPLEFVGTRMADQRDLARLWDAVALGPGEDDATKALQIIEPTVERLAFLAAESSPFDRQAVLKLTSQPRAPLGTFGEGMQRLLQLALSLAHAGGGYLLVDEIDTGLHYTVLEDLWRLVIKTAARLDVQVFATTHSRDCLHALAKVIRVEPALASEASVHRVERGAPTTTRYTAQELVIADRASMEIR